jgi:hypothetical protein
MHRTVTALYDTLAQAEAARDALRAAHLGDDVDIRDQTHDADATGDDHPHGITGWLKSLFGGHPARHVYGEGLRRGHVLLAAKVDELNEIRAATILDNAGPVDMRQAETSWRNEGWTPQSEAHAELDDKAFVDPPVAAGARAAMPLSEPRITANTIDQSQGRESALMDGRVRAYDVKA